MASVVPNDEQPGDGDASCQATHQFCPHWREQHDAGQGGQKQGVVQNQQRDGVGRDPFRQRGQPFADDLAMGKGFVGGYGLECHGEMDRSKQTHARPIRQCGL